MGREGSGWRRGVLAAVVVAGAALSAGGAREVAGERFVYEPALRVGPVLRAEALEIAQRQPVWFDEDVTVQGPVYRPESGKRAAGEDPTTREAEIVRVGDGWMIKRWVLLGGSRDEGGDYNHYHVVRYLTPAWFHLTEWVGAHGEYTLLHVERAERPGDWEERRLGAIFEAARQRSMYRGPLGPYDINIYGWVEGMKRGNPGDELPYAVTMRAHDKNLPETAEEREMELINWQWGNDDGYTYNHRHSTRAGRPEFAQKIHRQALRPVVDYGLTLKWPEVVEGSLEPTESDRGPHRAGLLPQALDNQRRGDGVVERVEPLEALGIRVGVTIEAGMRVKGR